LGGGLVASETASLLAGSGHEVALITRSLLPGASAIGEHTARRLLELHQPQHAAYLGRTPRAIRTHTDRITVVLDDGTRAEGDLAIVAHGTLPAAPAPWTGPEGIPVDSHLPSLHAPRQGIYAAGGVAVHHYPGHASYRIDHWDDSTAQGAHAARALLYDLGSDDDPGTYLPVSPFSARIHGHTLTGPGHPARAPTAQQLHPADHSTARGPHAARPLLYDLGSDDDPGTYLPVSPFSARIPGHTLTGAGHPALGTTAQVVSTDPLLTVHHRGDIPVALTGIDSARLVHDWLPHLHQQATVRH